ncbi:MAG: dihydropteroate synthase [Puniceicoccales bacterium]|jgi:dihydropteroate synthase|nr:dihydropteroate synthase [Puniceicoccales bacterium]
MATDRFYIWGILNCTPDSFSDGDPTAAAEDFVRRGLELVADGADVLDVGGASSRAGAAPVTVEEELARVLPVIGALRSRCGVPISIDSYRPEIVDRALAAGANIANDIHGLRDGGAMAEVVARHGARVVAMHWRPEALRTGDILEDIQKLWGQSIAIARAAGIGPERVILDPGFGEGFHKPLEQNLRILQHLPQLSSAFPDCAVLFALSRKSFLGTVAGEPHPKNRDCLGAAATYGAYRDGLRHFRVHNVSLTRKILRLGEAVHGAR